MVKPLQLSHQSTTTGVDFYVIQLNQINKQLVLYYVQFQAPLELVYFVVQTSISFGNIGTVFSSIPSAIPNTKFRFKRLLTTTSLGYFTITHPKIFIITTTTTSNINFTLLFTILHNQKSLSSPLLLLLLLLYNNVLPSSLSNGHINSN
ncbi:hypothetical protein ACTFIW_011055 [Dictyostelium discoideum]